MSCGCPVVSSNAGAIPEVVGDAALTVDPLDEASLASALGNVLTDEARRKEMIARDLNRASQFSWERAARETAGLRAGARRNRSVFGDSLPLRPCSGFAV